ncbi:MAG: 50S ribosome-binding GTPase [Candidatus Micrarchaeota archaeon]|nr:50S ribosome-binding GTPase [Candidatus Micrarchaeota archaeon]
MPYDDISAVESQIKKLEEEIRKTQKNKATEHHIGLLKAKIAKLRKQSEKKKGSQTKISVRKDGDATVAMIGYPSVGKSSLLNSLTNAKSKVAEYEFTTIDCIPGIMDYKGVKIQILDLPGIIEGASEGKGMGKEILAYARMSDLLLLVIDLDRENNVKSIIDELEKSNFRLNEPEPNYSIIVKYKDGINITSTVEQLSQDREKSIKDIVISFGIHNADIILNEKFDLDRFIDKLEGNKKYVNSLIVINKAEDIDMTLKEAVINNKKFVQVYVSALTGKNLDILRNKIWENLNLIRVYPVKRNNEVDDKPLVLKSGSTVEEVCRRLHKDLLTFFKYAKIKGKSVKFDNQKVGLDHVLKDGDIITIYTK